MIKIYSFKAFGESYYTEVVSKLQHNSETLNKMSKKCSGKRFIGYMCVSVRMSADVWIDTCTTTL